MLQVNQIFEAEVRDLASDGKGVVVHPEGCIFFVAGVWLNERGRFRITKVKGRIGFASLHELVEASTARVAAPCPHHGHSAADCGGCPWQYIDYQSQLAAKQARVSKAFSSLVDQSKICPIWPAPKTQGYRNRAQLKTDGKRIGFMAAKTQALVAVEDCLVLSQKNRQTLADIIAYLPQADWRPAHKRELTRIDIDESTELSTVSVNRRLPFAQANAEQNFRMRTWLQKKLSETPQAQYIVELFCGSGNFTEVIAACGFKSVLAVDSVDSALGVLEAKCLANVKVKKCDLFDAVVVAKLAEQCKLAEILVLDPPRDGMKKWDPFFKKKSKISDVFYISCDLATLVRDIKALAAFGFRVKEVQALDQLPHTPHIELLVHLKK